MFGLVGGVINTISLFGGWGAVAEAADGTIEAGSNVKKWFDEQEKERLADLYAEFSLNRSLPDLSLSHVQAAYKAVPGICNLSWTEVSARFEVEPDDPGISWNVRNSEDGWRGWIGFKQDGNMFSLIEQFKNDNTAVITFAQLADDYWLIFQSIAEKNSNDSSPCILTYASQVWKPDGLAEIFLGASQSKLETAADQYLNELVAVVRSDWEVVVSPKSITDELQSLVALRDAGQLSDEEFLAAKKKIIET